MTDRSPIPSPSEVKGFFPLSEEARQFLTRVRKEAGDIVSGRDMRKALIVGPCSIHNKQSALEYAVHLKELVQEVDDTCFLVMRVYFEKSRTSTGWKGFLYDPHLDASHDVSTGLLWTRELLALLTEMQIPLAAEFVDPLTACYFEDLITWGFVGARTAASQPHRQLASSLQIPMGFKNSTNGALDDALHGIAVARTPHTFLYAEDKGVLCMQRSNGNPYAHIVLRGGHHSTNYDMHCVSSVIKRLEKARLPRRILIDCSHGNSQKQHNKQKEVFGVVLEQMHRGNDALCGLMLESHLESGFQPLCEDPTLLESSISITDPCISWTETEELILSAHELLYHCRN